MSRETPARRDEFAVWRDISTRWADNDVYGHVNNTVYYTWFDTAVNSWLIEQGMLDIIGGNPVGLVVETRCSYFAPLSYPQAVEAGLRVAKLGTSSIRYRIGIFAKGADSAAAQGDFVHVVVDRQSRRPVPIPDQWRTKLDAIS
ncbi:acyl-CoA thioesterase [Sphingomonas sabuli]|uniref:Acyl-CoA thioesterase n=1 Tax=Sphingomonas sabuli TaxID=2764186 RepID=A0A7G9L419_9SPHN|nr:thioesterase family protein [Sphingomonas sabuli]QNM83368.1 acyl-CoA thioesterase [Sphingomonas sabuli]